MRPDQPRNSPISRRQFLAGVGAVTAGGTAGMTGINRLRSAPSSFDIEVSIFTCESLAQESIADGYDPLHGARVVESLVHHMVPTLSTSSTDINVDVTVSETLIPERIINKDNMTVTLNAFQTYLELGRVDDTSAHSNLLLYDGSGGSSRLAGKATVPIWDLPIQRLPASVFVNGNRLFEYTPETAPLGLHVAADTDLVTPVHEIGHNLGFHHDEGHATTDREWAEQHIRGSIPDYAERWTSDPDERVVYSTIMQNTYPRGDYGGTENAFGQRIPEVSATDTVATLPTFNPELDPSHLYHANFQLDI